VPTCRIVASSAAISNETFYILALAAPIGSFVIVAAPVGALVMTVSTIDARLKFNVDLPSGECLCARSRRRLYEPLYARHD
jgi:hypothetical protein